MQDGSPAHPFPALGWVPPLPNAAPFLECCDLGPSGGVPFVISPAVFRAASRKTSSMLLCMWHMAPALLAPREGHPSAVNG